MEVAPRPFAFLQRRAGRIPSRLPPRSSENRSRKTIGLRCGFFIFILFDLFHRHWFIRMGRIHICFCTGKVIAVLRKTLFVYLFSGVFLRTVHRNSSSGKSTSSRLRKLNDVTPFGLYLLGIKRRILSLQKSLQSSRYILMYLPCFSLNLIFREVIYNR